MHLLIGLGAFLLMVAVGVAAARSNRNPPRTFGPTAEHVHHATPHQRDVTGSALAKAAELQRGGGF